MNSEASSGALIETYQHYRALREEMDHWLAQSVSMDPSGRNGGGEDEANYALAWVPHYLVTGSETVKYHFEYLRDMLAGWVERECKHGYEPRAEAHHGTEPFLLFLPRYLGLFPDDHKAQALLEDAAHHIGNWVEGVPNWFDYERNRFWGYQIGSEEVNSDPNQVVEIAEHFRFIHIALAAHRVLGDEKYLDWSVGYGTRRARMIVDVPEGPLPVAWGPDAQPVHHQQATNNQQAEHHVTGDPLAGLECLLASGAIYALGDLYKETGDAVFRDAARRLIFPLIDQLRDPYCDPGAAAISYYRVAFADEIFDSAIRAVLDSFSREEAGELALVFPERHKRSWPGVGKRADMAYWGVWDDANGSVSATQEPCSTSLMLAYQLTGEVNYARRALRQAARKLKMARRVLRGGREHADMGGAVCSIAAGHGRNWGHGVVTGCYGPLLLGTQEIKSNVTPSLCVLDSQQHSRLPEAVLSLYRPNEIPRFYCGGDEQVTFSRRIHGGDQKQETLAPGESNHRNPRTD